MEQTSPDKPPQRVAAGAERSFASRFHDPGTPQVEVVFVDDHTAKILVPDITIISGEHAQPLEWIIQRQDFALKYRPPSGEQEIFYQAFYHD